MGQGTAAGRMKGIRAGLISAVFLGLAPVFGKQAILVGFSPLATVALRTVIATVMLLVLMLISQRSYFYIYPVGLVGCLLAGFVNGVGSVFYYSALGRLDAGVGQILYSLYPLFVAFWLILDRQRLSRLTLFRLILSAPAVYFLISGPKQTVDLVGVGFMLIASILYGLHLIINQRVLYDVPAPTVTLYTLIAMSAVTIPAYGIFDRQLPATGVSWWPIIGLAVIMFFSRLTLFLGVKHVGGLQTALLGLAELFVTVLLAYCWLGERLAPGQWIGVALLGISLLLVGYDRFTPEKQQDSKWLAWLHPSWHP